MARKETRRQQRARMLAASARRAEKRGDHTGWVWAAVQYENHTGTQLPRPAGFAQFGGGTAL